MTTARTNQARLTVVTGPAGVDIGPVAAHLGRDLGDGLTVRTVVSGPGRTIAQHTSPIPDYVPAELSALAPGSMGGQYQQVTGVLPGRVLLFHLPSAWQNPDTNLGVAYSGPVMHQIALDFDRLHHLGVHPGHRVTVQRRPGPGDWINGSGDALVPRPVQFGDLAEHARDSVWRGAEGSNRHVLVEAGEGQTFLDALHTVGIPPWTPHVERVELWTVLDARTDWPTSREAGTVELATARFTARIGAEVFRNGGMTGIGPTTGMRGMTMRVAVLNVDALIPGLAGRTTADVADLTPGADVGDQVVGQLADLLVTISNNAGSNITPVLFTTGTDPGSIIDLR